MKLCELHSSTIQVQIKEKYLAPNGIHIPDGPTCTIDLEKKKKNSAFVDRNKRPALGRYSSIRVQRMHEQRNTLTGHLRNYESVSGIPIQRTEIQTSKSTTYVDVCLTVVSFSTTAYKNK